MGLSGYGLELVNGDHVFDQGLKLFWCFEFRVKGLEKNLMLTG